MPASQLKHPVSRFQQRSSKQRLEYTLTQFNGIDNSNDPASIDPGQSPETLNTILDSIGSIETRLGYSKLLSTKIPTGPSNNGIPFYKSDGTKQLVYRAGTTLYRYNNAGGSTAISGTLTASTADDMDIYNDTLYGVDGTIMYSYTGTGFISTVAPAGVFSNPQYIRVHKNRVWVFQGSTAYFSDAGQPTSFPANNYININTNDGQSITGVEVLIDSLIIFKTDSIWVITGEPLGAGTNTAIANLNLRRANSAVGCVAYRTIKRVDAVIFFMARSGLYIFENFQSRLISQPINSTFKSGMSTTNQYQSWGLYSPVQKKYLAGYPSPGSATPDSIICYDLLVKRFTLWDHFPGAWAANFRFNPIETALMGDNAVGNIYNLFTGYTDIAGDNGTATGGTITTLVDTTKSWATNLFTDCRVQIVGGVNTGVTGTITSNTSNTLTISGIVTAPGLGSQYTIGGYNSYWKSRIFDFDSPAMSKRYKYLNLFMDSEAIYNLLVGVSLDFSPLTYNLPSVPLGAGNTVWDNVLASWDGSGLYYDNKLSLFRRAGLSGQGRFIQVIFGNNLANQPWRVFDYSITYKLKKSRPN